MGKLCAALAAVICGALIVTGCTGAGTRTSVGPALTVEEKMDVALVESHSRVEREARAIYERAAERARNAVLRSSLGERWQRSQQAHEQAKFWWEYQYNSGKAKTLGESIALALMSPQVEKAQAEYLSTKREYEAITHEVEQVLRKAIREFLDHEIAKLVESGNHEQKRELESVMKAEAIEI